MLTFPFIYYITFSVIYIHILYQGSDLEWIDTSTETNIYKYIKGKNPKNKYTEILFFISRKIIYSCSKCLYLSSKWIFSNIVIHQHVIHQHVIHQSLSINMLSINILCISWQFKSKLTITRSSDLTAAAFLFFNAKIWYF